MAGYKVAVSSRIVGREAEMDTVMLEIEDEHITVAELIRRTVEEQISTLLFSRRLDREAVRCALARQYLTQEEITMQAQRGRVHMPSEKAAQEPVISSSAEVQRAVDAFTRKQFYIFVQGRQIDSLEEELSFTEQTSVTFLRLMPLVGG